MPLYPDIVGYRGQQQTRYLIEMDAARPGLFVIQTQVEAATVTGQDVAQVSTLTITAGSGNYTATLEGETTAVVAFDTDDNTTAGLLTDALRELDAAANYVITVAANVITVTHRFTGVTFVLDATGTGAVVATPTAAAQSSPITIGTLVRIADGQENDQVLPASAGDTNWGIAGGSDYAQLNYFDNNPDGLQVVERGLSVSILREGTCWALFEVAATPVGGILYRDTADGALDVIGILNPNAGAGLTAPTDMSIRLLQNTVPLENGFHAGLVEVKL